MSSTPPSAPVDKPQIDLIAAQANRIGAQVAEIDRLWQEVQVLHKHKLDAERKVDEHRLKYAQLRLEAWLGLWKLVTVAAAVVVVAGLLAGLIAFKPKEVADLLKAARPAEPSASAPAAKPAGGSSPASSSSAPGGASAAASGAKSAPPAEKR
jgi:hypothetical protein